MSDSFLLLIFLLLPLSSFSSSFLLLFLLLFHALSIWPFPASFAWRSLIVSQQETIPLDHCSPNCSSRKFEVLRSENKGPARKFHPNIATKYISRIMTTDTGILISIANCYSREHGYKNCFSNSRLMCS
jgi:hypothetical protein